jgi:hypothetical protein
MTPAAALATLQAATLSPAVIKNSGAGKSYQSVAQSTAIAVSDATTYLRNLETISSTTIGAAIAKFFATGDAEVLAVIPVAIALVPAATADLAAIGAAANTILATWPK